MISCSWPCSSCQGCLHFSCSAASVVMQWVFKGEWSVLCVMAFGTLSVPYIVLVPDWVISWAGPKLIVMSRRVTLPEEILGRLRQKVPGISAGNVTPCSLRDRVPVAPHPAHVCNIQFLITCRGENEVANSCLWPWATVYHVIRWSFITAPILLLESCTAFIFSKALDIKHKVSGIFPCACMKWRWWWSLIFPWWLFQCWWNLLEWWWMKMQDAIP